MVNNKNNDDISIYIYYIIICAYIIGVCTVADPGGWGGWRFKGFHRISLSVHASLRYNRSYVKADYLIVQELAN